MSIILTGDGALLTVVFAADALSQQHFIVLQQVDLRYYYAIVDYKNNNNLSRFTVAYLKNS